MLKSLSLAIAATQVRTYIEVNCQVVQIEGEVEYDLHKENTEFQDEELTEHFNNTIKLYKDWIIALTLSMDKEEAIATIGFWPLMVNDKVKFQA